MNNKSRLRAEWLELRGRCPVLGRHRFLLILWLGLNLADLAATLVLFRVGFQELNPVLRGLPPVAMGVLKMFLVLAIAWAILKYGHWRLLYFANAIVLLVVSINLAQIIAVWEAVSYVWF